MNTLTIRLLLLLIISPVLFGEKPQMTVTLSNNVGQIGTPITLTIVVKSSTDIDKLSPGIKSEKFEISAEGPIKKEQNSGYSIVEKNLTLLFWETGKFEIESFPVALMRKDETVDTLMSKPVSLTILSTLKADEKELKPIKPLAEVIGTILYFLKYLGIFIAVVLLLIATYFFVRKKLKHTLEKTERSKYPFEVLEADYSVLKGNDLIHKDNIKLHFLKLTEINKRFLNGHYGFNAEDLTTLETLVHLKRIEGELEVVARFDSIFTLSDKVKFARYIPEENELSMLNETIISLISTYRKRQAERDRIEAENAQKDE